MATSNVDCPTMPQNLKELYELKSKLQESGKYHGNTGGLHVSLRAFQIQRPIGRVMIVLMGQSGTGKSTTINRLFDDKALCEENKIKSGTDKVTEYRKLMNVSGVKAYLSIIDTPGTFDTTKAREEINMGTIEKFRANHPAFWSGNEGIVYPNLVLITVRASDNRLDGENSFFCQTLKTIIKTKLLDLNRVNLIVAATFALQVSTNAESFAREKQQIRYLIAEIVYKVLGISNVRIIFIENDPSKYNVKKSENNDFYKLPDGELTPLNLFEAMNDQFKSNGDFFGSLVTSRYFNENCQEKKLKVETIPWQTYPEPSNEFKNDLNLAFKKLTDCSMMQWEEDISLNLVLQYAGCGYSPLEECIKTIKISDTTFALCEKLRLRDKKIHKFNFANVEDYKQFRLQNYGLESRMALKFFPDLNSTGKWRNGTNRNGNYHNISFVFEERLGTMVFGEVLHKTSLLRQLQTDLDDLPGRGWFDGIISPKACQSDKFRSFFDKWGTHYITEVGIGGSIRVDCSIPSSFENIDYIEERIENKIESLVNHEDFEGDLKKLIGDNHIWIKFYGGTNTQPRATELSEVTPQMFVEWETSLKERPVELENTIKLKSYEVFVDDKYKKMSFKEASLIYMRDRPQKLIAKRSVEASLVENFAIVSLKAVLNAFAAILNIHQRSINQS